MSGIYELKQEKLCENDEDHDCCAMCGNCPTCVGEQIDELSEDSDENAADLKRLLNEFDIYSQDNPIYMGSPFRAKVLKALNKEA